MFNIQLIHDGSLKIVSRGSTEPSVVIRGSMSSSTSTTYLAGNHTLQPVVHRREGFSRAPHSAPIERLQ